MGLGGAGAQGLDAEGEVLGQFGEQGDLRRVEGVCRVGEDAEVAEGRPIRLQGQGDHGAEAVAQGRVGPGREVAAVGQVAQDDRLAALAGDAAGAAAVAGVGPGQRLRGGKGPVLLSRMGHHADPRAAAAARIADPGEAVAAHLDQVGAEGVEESALVQGAGQAAVAAGEDRVGAAQTPQVLASACPVLTRGPR